MNNDVTNELGTNFIEYAVAVNTDRAIPDATSGLKPVARRILWSAFESGRTSSKPHVKSGMIVGDVMGKYHPHRRFQYIWSIGKIITRLGYEISFNRLAWK